MTSLDRQADSQLWDEWRGDAGRTDGQQMHFKYTQTRRSMLAGMRLHTNWLAMLIWTGGAFGLVTFLIDMLEGVASRASLDVGKLVLTHTLGGAAFGVGMSIFLWLLLLPYRAWTVHRQNPMIFGPTELLTNTEGFEIKAPRGGSQLRWSELRGYREGKTIFQLCLSKSIMFTIPKANADPDMVEALRREFGQNLKRL